MVQILCRVPNPHDATSLYRAAGPFNALGKENRNIKFNYQSAVTGSGLNWQTIGQADVMFMQRPFQSPDVTVARLCKENNMPLWVDYDDDLYSVPFSNPTNSLYGRKDIQNNITEILMMADRVTVSTPALRVRLLEIMKAVADEQKTTVKGSKVVVVPNAYDEDKYSYYRKQGILKDRLKMVNWRGSSTHDKDLMCYTRQLAEAAEAAPNWSWQFIGSPFWYVVEVLTDIPTLDPKKIMCIAAMDPMIYMRHVWQTAAAFTIVPLHDNIFNRSKSNIAYIEASAHGGSPCLVPEWDEWKRPGAITYSTPEEFGEKLQACMRHEIDPRPLAAESYQYVMDTLTLKKVNRIRERVIKELLETKT